MTGINLTIEALSALLPHCDDDLKNLDTFLGQSNLLYEKMKPEDQSTFCLMFRVKLKPAGYELIKSLGLDATWEQIQAALKSETMPPISKHAAQQQMASARQKPGETVHAYAKRTKELLRTLNDASTAGVGNAETVKYILKENERLARHTFEDGLSNGELRTYTRSGRNTDLASAISQAMDGEPRCGARQPIVQCGYCKRHGHSEAECQKKKGDAPRPATCERCQKPGHEAKNCRVLLDSQRKMNATVSTSPTGSATTNPPNGGNVKANIECRYCHALGHYANECPKRPGNSAQRPVATATFSNRATASDAQTIGNYFATPPAITGQPNSGNAAPNTGDQSANMFQLTKISPPAEPPVERPRRITVPFLDDGTKIRISVKFTSAQREVIFLIDSGATLSVINGRTLHPYTVFYPKAKMTMMGISPRDEIPTLGLTFGCLQMGGIDFPHEFQVVDDRVRMTTDGLLGCDFLLRYGAMMDFGHSDITLCSVHTISRDANQ